MRIRSLSACLTAAAFALGTAACTDAADPSETVAAALELDNGGLDLDDEAPEFGDPADLDAAALEASNVYADPLDGDAAVIAMRVRPGAARTRVVLAWGQLPPDLQPEATARDWSGALSLNRGAMVVRRTIGFEQPTDRVLPRTGPTVIDFASITQPFADGLVLEIVDDDPTNATPLTLHYARTAGGTHDLVIEDLLVSPVHAVVDGEGNRIVAIALRDDDACDHGFARGRWRALRPDLGGLIGQVVDADGAPIGHVRGIWGERRNGDQVYFGKYIDVAGHLRGLFVGHYQNGQLVGHWMTRAGEVGRLDGRYEESLPGQPAGGHFIMRWSETSCAAGLPEA